MSLDISRKDTICAMSSAHGIGAIAIVRASGPRAHEIFHRMFRKKSGVSKPGRAMHGAVVNQRGEMIDDVMAIVFAKGRSFTGEESCEIHCHGNGIIVDEILQTLVAHGARLAEPGEFSMRAVLSGKIDLAQAESIKDLIHAKSIAAKDVALKGVQGGLRDLTSGIRHDIVATLAEIEARMDFPDEELGGYDRQHLVATLDRSIAILKKLLMNAPRALRLHEGARVVICGAPNAGKSTLLNRLCEEEKAIVHETAGTTRDVIEANVVWDGIPITLIDIAGIRAGVLASAIEKIGIDRAFLEINRAQLVVWLADGTRSAPFGDEMISDALRTITVPVLRVINKSELVNAQSEYIAISAKLGLHIEELKSAMLRHIKVSDQIGELYITRARQRDELMAALSGLEHGREALVGGMVDEVITSELRAAGLSFDRLFGTELAEDVLDKIFSEFCIGK